MKRDTRNRSPWLAALALTLSLGGCSQQAVSGAMDDTGSNTGNETASAVVEQEFESTSSSYETQRKVLLAQELSPQQLTDSEVALDNKLAAMKAEANALFADGSPFGIDDWSKPAVAESRLFGFCKALPKGADLHAHDVAAIRTDTFIDLLQSRNNIVILLDDESEENGSLYVQDIEGVPEFATPLQEALAQPEEGEEPLLTREMLREFLVRDQENPDWIDLNALDGKVAGLSQDQEFVNAVYQTYFGAYAQNGVNLVELRVPMQEDDTANAAHLTAIRNAYFEFKSSNPDFVVRVIAYPSSGNTNKEASCNELRSAIRLSEQIKDGSNTNEAKDFIVGLDLGSENASAPLKEYVDFFGSDEVSNSGLKLFLHCGESLDTTSDDVVDAYLLGTSRIGHGITLYRFPALMDSYAKDKIAIEVCPTGNYRKGYVHDLRLHPGLLYMRNGNQVVLGSGDGAFAEPSVLTDDFFAAILCWDLSLADIKTLCHNSIAYSGLAQDEIDLQLATWEYLWNDFVARMTQG